MYPTRRALLSAGLAATALPARAAGEEDEILDALRLIASGDADLQREPLKKLELRRKTDVVAALIDLARYVDDDEDLILATLARLTGNLDADEWLDWMNWQQLRPEIASFPGYAGFKRMLFGLADPRFAELIPARGASGIRPAEIAWSGIKRDGVPALTEPRTVMAAEAAFMAEDELVFGVAIGKSARAYPARIVDWHEVVNDSVDGTPLCLAYCVLTGAPIVFDRRVSGAAEPLRLETSGLLYRSNKLLVDTASNSLWVQFEGRAVTGTMFERGAVLKRLPLVATRWSEWRKTHPASQVLSLETGHARDYGPGKAHVAYRANPLPLFPVVLADRRLNPKDPVYGVRHGGAARAWPLAALEGGKRFEDRIGDARVVVEGGMDRRDVRVRHADNGRSLEGHLAYWFAWASFNPGTGLYGT